MNKGIKKLEKNLMNLLKIIGLKNLRHLNLNQLTLL